MPVPKNNLNEVMEYVVSCIDNRTLLSEFEYHSYMRLSDTIPDDSRQMVSKALVSGAAGKAEDAITFFEKSIMFRDEFADRNYLAYLLLICRYDLYREVVFRVAKSRDSCELCREARDAAYAAGDVECSLFFARKAASLIAGDAARRGFMAQSENNTEMLESFMSHSGLSQEDISALTMTGVKVAKEKNIPFTGVEYYISRDCVDLAMIMYVFCDDIEVMADMDIDLAYTLAVSEQLAHYKGTAWFRTSKKEGEQRIEYYQ
ncbi:hypothetical protein OZO98_001750 [Salmonella enterica]|nr:hypothetical protein [Salmonella enterica]